MKTKFISRSEEYLLLAVMRLKKEAYGVAIRDQLKESTGHTWAYGAIFVMLSRLEKKGLLESFLTDPTPQRGGRSKRIYFLTPKGEKVLAEIKKVHEAVWEDYTELLPAK
jgi:DNA-binding PadR family transcriptional regulator